MRNDTQRFYEPVRRGFDACCRGIVPSALLTTLAATVFALTPPREATHAIGIDSKGVAWQVRLAVDEPLVVFVVGAQSFPVRTEAPLDFDVHAAIDSRDTAWIVDGKGLGVRVNLSDGTAKELRVPVSGQLVGGIAVRDGQLYFGDSGSSAGRRVLRMDVVSGETKTLLTLGAEWSVRTMVSGKHHLWIAAWTGLATSQHTIELIALDWATGNVALQSRREMPRANPAWSMFEVVEAEDGAAWVADGYSARVERLDRAGTWQGWSLHGRTPSNLVATRSGAVCLLQRLQPPEEEQFSGAPIQHPTVLQREIAAFQSGSRELMTYPVETHVTLSVDHDGSVLVDGRGRLALEGGRLQIVPAATPAAERSKQPS